MKIVHICLSCFFIDGFSYQENILPKYHVKMGYDVTIIASLKSYNKEGKLVFLDSPSEYVDPCGFKVIRLAYKKPLFLNVKLEHYVGLSEVLNEELPDIIFMHGAAIGDSDKVVKYVKHHPGVKLFCDSHADYYNSGTSWLSLHVLNGIIRRHYLKRTEKHMLKYFGVTPWRCKFLIDVYGAKKENVEFLPMGVDDESLPDNFEQTKKRIREELNIPIDAILVFTGGKINKEKNIQYLIDSVNNLNEREGNRYHVVICGVIEPQMERIIMGKMNNQIHYLGWCNAERVIDCMAASDIACFPGTHSTLWEQSVGVGLPIIYKQWDYMEHVNPCKNGMPVTGDDTKEISDALQRMSSSEEYGTFKQNASEAAKRFRYSDISKKAIGL